MSIPVGGGGAKIPACSVTLPLRTPQEFPQKHIRWPTTIPNNKAWWQPHGNYPNTDKVPLLELPNGGNQAVPSCCNRLVRFKERLLTAEAGNVAIVTHPSVLAAFTGSLELPRCKPVQVVMGYSGFGEMAVQEPVVSSIAVPLLHVAADANTAIVVLGMAGESAGVIKSRVHHALALMQNLQMCPVLLMGAKSEFVAMRAAVDSFPWPLTPLQRRYLSLPPSPLSHVLHV